MRKLINENYSTATVTTPVNIDSSASIYIRSNESSNAAARYHFAFAITCQVFIKQKQSRIADLSINQHVYDINTRSHAFADINYFTASRK